MNHSVVRALVVATMPSAILAGVMARRIVGPIAATSVVVAGVVARRVIGTLPAHTVVVLGVVARGVIGAGRRRPHTTLVIMGVVPGWIVGRVRSCRPAPMMVMAAVARGIVMPPPDHLDLGRVLESVVDLMPQAAARGQRHAPLQGLQCESSGAPSSMRYHDASSYSPSERHRASPV